MTDRPSFGSYVTHVSSITAIGIVGVILLPGSETTRPVSHWLWVACVSAAQFWLLVDWKRRL